MFSKLRPGKTLFVSVNSCYFFGAEILRHAKEGDAIYVTAHVGHNNAKSVENDYSAGGFSDKVEFNDYYIYMAIKNTSDVYKHKSNSMICYDVFDAETDMYNSSPAPVDGLDHAYTYYDFGIGG